MLDFVQLRNSVHRMLQVSAHRMFLPFRFKHCSVTIQVLVANLVSFYTLVSNSCKEIPAFSNARFHCQKKVKAAVICVSFSAISKGHTEKSTSVYN
jgi:hypothetical protein